MSADQSSVAALADAVSAREPRAVARAISLVENEHPDGAQLIRRLYGRGRGAYLVGITGPPGAGKSTLVDRLIQHIRPRGQTVGVVAVDPTSPFTGGAILGDRVRMQSHAADPGVFIRSMATRGELGGLARTTDDVALILDAAGADIILIETVGVGQAEVDIVRTADVTIVIVVPGAGDEVQTLKAGVMEIADVFVVNKADREGADRTVGQIEAMLSLRDDPAGLWRPPVVPTVATTGGGVEELWTAVMRYRDQQAAAQATKRRARAEFRLRDLMAERFARHALERVLGPGEFDALVDRVARRELDPYSAAEGIVNRAVKS